ncbi:hypothetical protein ACFXA8_12110, partial [Streptomyces sp. NPDC059409]
MKKTLSRRARVATGGAVLAAVAAGTFGTVAANASAPESAQLTPGGAAPPPRRPSTTERRSASWSAS